jgi:hypothetical protein
MTIEETYKENFRRIELSGLKKGDILIHKQLKHQIKVISIHPLYGWVVTDPHLLNQNMDNLFDYAIIESIKKNEDETQKAFCRFGGKYDKWCFYTNMTI